MEDTQLFDVDGAATKTAWNTENIVIQRRNERGDQTFEIR